MEYARPFYRAPFGRARCPTVAVTFHRELRNPIGVEFDLMNLLSSMRSTRRFTSTSFQRVTFNAPGRLNAPRGDGLMPKLDVTNRWPKLPPVASVVGLRAAASSFRRLVEAALAHPGDEQLNQMLRRAGDALYLAQERLAARGIAKEAEDGSIVTDLGDGHEFVVYQFVDQEPESKHHLRARAWL